MSYPERSWAKTVMLEMGVRAEVKLGTYCGGGGKGETQTMETKSTEH